MNLRPFARMLVYHPKTVILLFTIFTFIIGSQAANLYMVSDMSVFLPKGEPTIELMEKIEKEWSLGSTIIVYVEGNNVLDTNVLKDIEYVTNSVDTYRHDNGEIDGVISSTSLVSLIKQENSLPPPFGTGRYELPSSENLIRKYLAQMGEMRKSFVTDDLKATSIMFILSDKADDEKILSKAQEAVSHVSTKMTLIGSLPMSESMKERSIRNMAIIFPLAALFISIVLFFFHRSLKGILITFLPPTYSIILTFGVLGMVSPEITTISVAIVALIMGLGVDYSIHLMNRFFEEEKGDLVDRVERTLKTTGKAVLLSTVTTMIGFGSLMISTMSPIISFGFGATIGILFCFMSASILVPPLIIILKFKKRSRMVGWKRLARFAADNSKKILIMGVMLAILSLMVFPQVKTDVNYFDMAPKGDPVIEKTIEYSEKFGTSGNLDMILIEGNLKDPKMLSEISNLEDKLRENLQYKGVSFYSVADAIKKFNLGRIPTNQVVLDFIMSNLMKQGGSGSFIDESFSKTLIIVNIPVDLSMEEYQSIVDKINDIIDSTTIPNGKVYKLTGATAINVAINDILFEQQTRSLFVSLLFVFASLIIIFRSSLYSALTMIPLVFVLLWEPGILVTFNIPLSVITISIASIIVGTGVDYGIHITQRVREGLSQGMNKEEAVKEAIEKTGLSLVEAAATTVGGLLAVYFVNVPGLQQFSIVIITMIIFSLLSAVFLMPAFYRIKAIR